MSAGLHNNKTVLEGYMAINIGISESDRKTISGEPDLLTQRMQLHEKTAWMLRSLLEG